MYLDYDTYVEYGGTLDETTFENAEFDAEATVDWYTFNRLHRDEWQSALSNSRLKRCMYHLIALKQKEEELLNASTGGVGVGIGWTKHAGITKESNDGVVTSYNTLSSGELMSFVNGDKMKRDILDRYLNGVINELGQSLLYRGIYPGE